LCGAFADDYFDLTTAHLLERATDCHRTGDLPEARRLYGQVLEDSPAHALALFRFGLLELQDGRPQASFLLINRAIDLAPGEARYQFGLGQTLAALRRWKDASAAYRRFLRADPRSPDAHFALGSALQSLGDYGDAIGAYQAAVQFRPEFADALNNLGNCHQLLGELPQAEAAYRRAMALRPSYAGAMSNLGTILQTTGRIDEAIELLRGAAKLEPGVVLHAVNLGAALCKKRDFAGAELVLRPALDRDANNAESAYNLGNALHGLGRLRDALNNLGNIYKELGEFGPAMAAYEAAIRAQPDSAVALNNLGCLLRTLGRLEEAEVILLRGLNLDARHPTLLNNFGNVLKDCGALDEAIDCYHKAVAIDPNDAESHSNLAYALSFQATDGQAILEECMRWNERHAAPLASSESVNCRGMGASPMAFSADNTARAGRPCHIKAIIARHSVESRLRIGYVSPDFRDHCQSLFTIPLLSHHDHTAFEIFCYASVERPDEYTRRIAGYADVWRDVRALDDAALCDQIRADQIDILVDLTMHMTHGRPLVFARKPAPIQVAWLAYPGTTGITAMDYRFSDPRLDPPGFETHYSERTIRLPDSFWCYDPLIDQPQVNALPALTRGCLTLGCLNNPCKLSDHTLQLWGAVMRRLPDARLLLMAPPGPNRRHLQRRLTAQGIASERVNLVPFRPRADYLRTYHDIDLGLDTFPYNGHTTSLDSFWMGVPVVTRVGQTCVGRGGLSQLFQLDLIELAHDTDEAFVDAAVALANNLSRLAELRQQLRARLTCSPLMDAKRFARNIEAAYRGIVQDRFATSARQAGAVLAHKPFCDGSHQDLPVTPATSTHARPAFTRRDEAHPPVTRA
jgi:predicted O-linked N-acetylglucosamine transferase (SPINDLY family)